MALDCLSFRPISQKSLTHGQNQFLEFWGDAVHWCCRSGEGVGSPSPVTPHPYLHHAKGCGNCYISDMTVLYTHIILICPGSKWLELDGNFPTEEFCIWKCWLDWIEMFGGKVLILSGLSVETKQACLVGEPASTPASSPTCPWTFWLCGQAFPADWLMETETPVRYQLSHLSPCMGAALWPDLTPRVGLFIFKISFDSFLMIFHPTEIVHVLFCHSIQSYCYYSWQ